MTNEERQQAIEWLKSRPITMPGAKKMYALAIEALEAYVPDKNVGKLEVSCESNTEITRCSDDTISRKALIDALFELYEYQRDTDPTEAADLVRQGIYLAEKKIEQLPPVQPKHGKWIERGTWSEGEGMGETYGKYWACNQCGRKVKGFWDECGKNFCDNCGADMRGSEK